MENEELETTAVTNDEVIDTGEEELAGKTPEEEALEALKGKDVDIENSGQKVDTTEEKKPEEQEEKEKVDVPKVDTDKPIEELVKEQDKAIEEVSKDLETKGINYDDIANEYLSKGELSQESYDKLSKAGYPKTVIDAFVRGWEATVEKFTNTVYDAAGGKQEYERICQFITSLGDKEVNAFNDVIENGNPTQVIALIEGYKARMVQKYGTFNRSVLGGNASGGNGGFKSKTAMVKAMNDPRYGSDPEYTAKVQKMTMSASFID